MHPSLEKIFLFKYCYASVFSFFVFLMGVIPVEQNLLLLLWYSISFSMCIGVLLKLMSELKVIVLVFALFYVIHFLPEHLSQFELVVAVANVIRNAESYIVLTVMTMILHTTILILEWYERNREEFMIENQ